MKLYPLKNLTARNKTSSQVDGAQLDIYSYGALKI